MEFSQISISDVFLAAWFAEDGEIFISFVAESNGESHIEHRPLQSAATEGCIRRFLRRKNGKSPNKYDVENFRNDLASLAYEKQLSFPTYLRTAEYEGKIYVDLGMPDWNCVEITKDGWKIIQQAPVPFRRNAHMHPLPYPEAGGSLDLLNEFVSFPSRADFLLFASFLVNAYHPTGPYFHLLLTGEKGSTKSSVARLLQKLIHPSSSSLKGMPKDDDNLVLEAYHNKIIMIDNENNLGKWLPNALCRLSTGSGMSSRILYTNRDQMAFKVARPAIITAHGMPTHQTDLIERSIHIELKKPERYITEKQLNIKFEQLSGKIVGAVFDAMSASLANRETMPEESLKLHRMSDAAYFICCASNKIGWESPNEFLMKIEANQSNAMVDNLTGNDPILQAVINAMTDRNKWEATPTEILAELRSGAKDQHLLPEAANIFSKRISNLHSILFAHGLKIEIGLKAPGGTHRLIRITKYSSI